MAHPLKSVGRYGTVGLELVLSLAVGWYLGHLADGKLGTRFLAPIGFVVGVYAGFRALWKAAKQMEKDAEREDREVARGGVPWESEYAMPDDEPDPDDEPASTPPKPDDRT